MGGELPTVPMDLHDPTVDQWSTFMTAVAKADAGATISIVIRDAQRNPVTPDFQTPAAWLTVAPRFTVKPPVVAGPVDGAWKPAVVTEPVKFRTAGELAGRALAVIHPGASGNSEVWDANNKSLLGIGTVWLLDGVTRNSPAADGTPMTWQFVKVTSPALADYGWIASDYLKIQASSG